jgi:hypothetical protein
MKEFTRKWKENTEGIFLLSTEQYKAEMMSEGKDVWSEQEMN